MAKAADARARLGTASRPLSFVEPQGTIRHDTHIQYHLPISPLLRRGQALLN